MDECSSYHRTLELSSGERLDELILLQKESYLTEDLGDTFMDRMIIITRYFEGKGDILFYRLLGEELKILEYHTDRATILEELIA
jgi:hypothetical protein